MSASRADRTAVVLTVTLALGACSTTDTSGDVGFYGSYGYYGDPLYWGGCCVDPPSGIGPPPPRPEHPIANPPPTRPSQPIARPAPMPRPAAIPRERR